LSPAEASNNSENGPKAGWDPKRIERRLLALETRRRIYEHVRNFPGIHLRQIVRELALGLGTVEHHLHVLARHGMIESRLVGPKRRTFFARDGRPAADKDLLAVLRGESLRRVLECFLVDPDMDALDIATRLDLASATVSYHLQRLVKWNVLEELRIGRSRLYRIREPQAVARLLEELSTEERLSRALSARGEDDVLQYLLARIPHEENRGIRRGPEERTIRA
jgi:DNA-binding transcriptional ArsR family regulator